MKMFRLALIFLVLSASLAFAADHIIPGQLVVRFKPGVVNTRGLAVASARTAAVSANSVRALGSKYGVASYEQLYAKALEIRPDWRHLADVYIVTVSREADISRAVDDYSKNGAVESAAPNTIVKAFNTPNDPLFPQQWALAKIQATAGWDFTTGSTESIIAVLDTGIYDSHEDFAGKVDTTHAWNFVSNNSNPLDDYGHGTAVSGVIGAVTNNGKGIAGLDWRCKILPIKVLGSDGQGPITNVNKALELIAALKSTGVNIVAANMSLGQGSPNVSLESDCQAAYNQGIVLVAAAGNEDSDALTYPASYSTVMAVAATDSNDRRSVWSATQASNYGSWVDISAPGTQIMATNMNGSYSDDWNGTSLACPHVAGLVGLIKAVRPDLSNAQVISRIMNTADNIDSLQSPAYRGKLGTGRINVYQAVRDLTTYGSIEYPASYEVVGGRVTVRGIAAGLAFAGYTLEALSNGSVEALIKQSVTAVSASNVLGTWETAGLNGDYVIRLSILATNGYVLEDGKQVTIDNISPEAAISSPAPGATISGQTPIVGTAKDLHLDRYVLEYGAGANPAAYQLIGTFYSPVNGSTLGNWQTAGLSGTYTLRLSAFDRAGNSSVTSETLSISEQAPTREVVPEPGLPLAFALPNPFNTTATAETSFVYDLKGNFSTVIYLFDINGNLIWRNSYAAGDNGGKAGRNTPTWNAKNLFGEKVDNGVYMYQIAADGKVIGRGKIIVLN
jgi:thermitase